jgi:tetratricopeptide (TPR) repeat protein
MKKITLLGIFSFFALTSFGQNSAVNKANTLIAEGEYEEAIPLVEGAIVHEKTMEKGRTWYVRGLVYNGILGSEDPAVQALAPDAAEKAYESFSRVKELEKEGSNYYTLTTIQDDQLYTNVFNKGASEYQNEQFMDAYGSFKTLILINEKDTVSYMYAGYCAEAAGEYELAMEQYYDLMKLDDCPKSIYNQALSILERETKDLEAALELTSAAMERYPDDQTFDKTQIALFIRLERTDEARTALEEALKLEPDNANLWYNLGYLYGEVGNFEKSVNAYEKSIEADPQYVDSYINLAFTYTEKAKEVRQEAMDMDIKTYQQKGAAIEKQADEYYKMALPVLEKANEVSPNDQAIMESLNGLYVRLKMNDKAEAISKKLVELGYWDDEN